MIEGPGSSEGAFDPAGIHDVDEFEALARARLPEATYGYVAGGAGREATIAHNREALDRLLLVPRMLRGVDDVDTSTTILGTKVAFPLLVAPSAVQRLATPEGELATARAVEQAGLLMVLSMNASTTVEEVCAVGAPVWMQLYFSPDRSHMATIVGRAEAAGVKALCITVDHSGMPTRLRELRRPLVVPPEVPFVHLDPDRAKRVVDGSLTWDAVDWLRGVTDLPIVLKGLLHPADAMLAAERGVDAVIVSNHGGRQLDGVVGALDVLPRVVDAIGDRCEVLVDGAIRTGPDLVKALASGARAGLVGRPIWWALAAGGEPAVARVLEIIGTDFEAAMRLCGCSTIPEVGGELLWRA